MTNELIAIATRPICPNEPLKQLCVMWFDNEPYLVPSICDVARPELCIFTMKSGCRSFCANVIVCRPHILQLCTLSQNSPGIEQVVEQGCRASAVVVDRLLWRTGHDSLQKVARFLRTGSVRYFITATTIRDVSPRKYMSYDWPPKTCFAKLRTGLCQRQAKNTATAIGSFFC